MSRLGKQPITLPDRTDVVLGEAGKVTVKGPKGELSRFFRPEIAVETKDRTITLSMTSGTRLAGALWGTYAAHVRNMVRGVNEPFQKVLSVEGVGYRAELTGQTLKLNLGFSHPVLVSVPTGLTVTVEKNLITIVGIDCEQVGQFAASVRALKKPEPYKGKGIRYKDEVVRRKQGKKSS
jgi:large subunit ribosomal protein L6